MEPNPEIDQIDLSVCALLVASKMEETIKKIKDVINKAYSNHTTDNNKPLSEAELVIKRKNVLECERVILKAINFDFNISEIHRIYIKFTKYFNVELSISKDGWHILNDR
ncbi:hypothetical protein BB561_004545 [Smittium simulii]|uniref:Cyclin N-terminal domain-containing protein n=1 Tax=Smittium simulii TaxID=133385 RepID=A0A2T9YFR8_9FUNG|nr:hypothetical protein BB561_004545 [Smittium simulii]